MDWRAKFLETFTEEDAREVEAAALHHAGEETMKPSNAMDTDPFLKALFVVCISACLMTPTDVEDHPPLTRKKEIDEWCRREKPADSYFGTCPPYMVALSGAAGVIQNYSDVAKARLRPDKTTALFLTLMMELADEVQDGVAGGPPPAQPTDRANIIPFRASVGKEKLN